MDIERLKAAVVEMQAVVNEMQSECREFAELRSKWERNHYLLFYSGLINKVKALLETKKHREMEEKIFSDDLVGIGLRLMTLCKYYEEFTKKRERLKEYVSKESYEIPKDYKIFEVVFKPNGSQPCYSKFEFFYAQTEEKAVELCRKKEGEDIRIIAVVEAEI